ncbi:SDR family oxidoreductase [Actinoplanes cyaneus]|uniref:SDR family oxidoreductase n=1 Tax=Actinoplanes cyaneus TaxID=52696 RepID=UPI001941502E|nr:SDR family oxidoreductase [Actinoplanes cyaneus]MCW2139993.1 NAD(P)-dependent dehydrogenase, short-chain alcohol dehydrogenase family [Actinoplanes cyaneus]
MNIATQRVVVLGGTSGIGYATAAAAAGQGAEVVVVSSDRRRVDDAAARLGATGLTADLTDPPTGLFERIGPFDHLVYTAGGPLSLMPVTSFDPRVAREFFGLRYFGALSAVRAALPFLREGGSITLTTGTAGNRPAPGWALGASICGAMDSLTRALAVELAPIRVNAVRPGVTRSPLWGDDAGDFYEQTAAGVPLGRVGEVTDVADAYLYLIGQSFTTGTILTVDGGALLA